MAKLPKFVDVKVTVYSKKFGNVNKNKNISQHCKKAQTIDYFLAGMLKKHLLVFEIL